ncbi:MAG: hypothetical protein TREMPRED_002378 [Tremellales sp. Tagirdzhanova-0007]|nr:MAG: hypothetical protein TREMPRED_002378 [Tremellales sp. Tagirdzhanova-0007]
MATAMPLVKRDSSLMGLISWKKKLTFDGNGVFKRYALWRALGFVISVICVLRTYEGLGNGSFAAFGPEDDANTQRVHATILDQEKPNYVVFNGDIMTGENVFADNATGYQDMCYQPTVERGIPFSSTHGNHDNANNINHNEEIEYEMAHYSSLSHTRSDVGPKPYGNGNYWVPVYAKDKDYVPAMIMWFFDSRSFVSGSGNGPGPIPAAANYYWVDENTVPAYIAEQSLLMRVAWGAIPPSLVFVHIPFAHSGDLDALPTEGDHDDDPDPSVQGYLANYTGLDLPTFNEIVQLAQGKNKVMAITSGHDHGDSWCGRSYNSSGLALCFDGHSGYGGYDTPNSLVRNGRVFNVQLADIQQEYPTVETWNSYENKTINDYVVLGPDYLKQYN